MYSAKIRRLATPQRWLFCTLGKNGYKVRTTLINTTFWKEESTDALHLDSKLLYLYMLTNPEKGLANIYHYKPRVMSAYSGLSTEQIEVAVKQLTDLGYVDIFDGYYVLLKGHEMPKKGRFTEATIEKEKELVPNNVLDHFNLLVLPEEHQKDSRVEREHNNNHNNKTNNKDITKTKPVDDLFDSWHDIVGYEIESGTAANRTAAAKLIKQHEHSEIERMLRGVEMSQSDQYAPRIANFVQLEKKWDELKAWGKRKQTTGEAVVV